MFTKTIFSGKTNKQLSNLLNIGCPTPVTMDVAVTMSQVIARRRRAEMMTFAVSRVNA